MPYTITTTLDPVLWKEAKQAGIKWHAALRAGIILQLRPSASAETVKQHTEDIERLKKLLDGANRTIRELRTNVAYLEAKK